MFLIMLETVSEAGEYLKKPVKGGTILAFSPKVRSFLAEQGLASISSADLIDRRSFESIMDKCEELENHVRKQLDKLSEDYLVKAYFHYWRLILRHMLWDVELLEKVLETGRYEKVMAFKYNLPVTLSPWVEDEQLFAGGLAEAVCKNKGLEFVNLNHGSKAAESNAFPPRPRQLDNICNLLAHQLIKIGLGRFSRSKKVLVSSFAYNLDLVCDGLLAADRDLKLCKYYTGSQGIRSILEAARQLMGTVLKQKIRKSSKDHPVDYALPIMVMANYHKKSYDVSKVRSFLNETLRALNSAGEAGFYRGVDVVSRLRQKVEQDLMPYLLRLHFLAFGLKKGMEELKPNYILSQMSFELNGALGEIAQNMDIPSVLISHGSHVAHEDKYAAQEHLSLAQNILAGSYWFSAVQSPLAETAALNLLKDPRRIVRIKPTLWGRKITKTRPVDALTILHAGTFKLRHNRRYIYETADEYLAALADICATVAGLENIRLVVKLRTDKYELPADVLNLYLPKADNIIIEADKSFAEVLSEAQLLVSFSSTAIEEALNNEIPVLLYGGGGRYAHIPSEPYAEGQEINRAATFIKNVSDLKSYLVRLNDNYRTFRVPSDKFTEYRFSNNEVVEFNDWFLGLAGGKLHQ